MSDMLLVPTWAPFKEAEPGREQVLLLIRAPGDRAPLRVLAAVRYDGI